jgi:hypothetical protein
MSRSVLDILKRWAIAFNIELAMSDSPAEAQARAAVAFTEAASAVGLDLPNVAPVSSTTDPSSGGFSHRALAQPQRKKMTFKFEPADGGGTHVRIDGAVARAEQPLVTDPGHWTDALDGSAA